jgi:hypothetical protein
MRNPTTGLASLYRGVTLKWIASECCLPAHLKVSCRHKPF